jgi:poly-gamma-glutamate synthesis protein (capsule biosynthesis protein)
MSVKSNVAAGLCVVLTLTACNAATPAPAPEPSPAPTQSQIATLQPEPTPTATPAPATVKTIWIDPVLPAGLHTELTQKAQAFAETASDPTFKVELTATQQADIRIAGAGAGVGAGVEGTPLITRTYAIAAPFPTVADGLTFEAFKQFWAGDAAALAALSQDEQTPPTLFLDPDTRAALVLLLGQPAANANIQLVPAQELLATTWAARTASLAVLPFDQLEARWKLLHLDGVNLFEREADMSAYPLTLNVRAEGEAELLNELSAAAPATSNRDLSKMAVVAMTGVTAMVRGTATKMEEKGVTYPGEKIQSWLTTADVAHISNEVSFYDDCPRPTRNDGTTMCSNPKYMELLRFMGTDVIELTGNHLWDYGARNLNPTIDLYDKEGWKYFGGGRNIADAMKPLTMTVNGNKIAFIGCNWFGANWADADTPGSAPCSPNDPRNLDSQIAMIQQLRAEGYLPIATLQYAEFYFYEPTPQQARDFAALRDAGAVVVNGSQGHHVQGFDVSAEGFIHWGTGNFFFGDQIFSRGALTTMVDRHVFYNNKYLGVDLRTAFIEDLSQPVPATPEDRAELLRTLFDVSRFR